MSVKLTKTEKFIKKSVDFFNKKRFKKIVKHVVKDFNKFKLSFYPNEDEENTNLLDLVGINNTFITVQQIIKTLVLYYINKFYKHSPCLKYFDIRVIFKDYSIFTEEELENEQSDTRTFSIEFCFISNISNINKLSTLKINEIFLQYNYNNYISNKIQILLFSNKKEIKEEESE